MTLAAPLEFFVPLLAMLTLRAVIVAAFPGAKRIDRRKADPTVPPSSLADDGDRHRKAD